MVGSCRDLRRVLPDAAVHQVRHCRSEADGCWAGQDRGRGTLDSRKQEMEAAMEVFPVVSAAVGGRVLSVLRVLPASSASPVSPWPSPMDTRANLGLASCRPPRPAGRQFTKYMSSCGCKSPDGNHQSDHSAVGRRAVRYKCCCLLEIAHWSVGLRLGPVQPECTRSAVSARRRTILRCPPRFPGFCMWRCWVTLPYTATHEPDNRAAQLLREVRVLGSRVDTYQPWALKPSTYLGADLD